MAQRLVRTICPECKTEWKIDAKELPQDFPGIDVHQGTHPPLWHGIGCKSCRKTGYRGRTGIHELMVNNDQIKEMIVQRVNAQVIRKAALANGMITLRADGWRKVLKGATTIDEVARVTAGDIIM